jgi:hypothetical protein
MRSSFPFPELLIYPCWFATVADARRKIEAWRQDYNAPHSALGYSVPREFAAELMRVSADLQLSSAKHAILRHSLPIVQKHLQAVISQRMLV